MERESLLDEKTPEMLNLEVVPV
ncbi:MAG: hypothetical protein ACKODZ_00455 [Verrucomicrobiota bacterium]